MAIITVTYARLWNLGNYENERLEAVATVESDATTAFAEAVSAVNDQHTLMQAERDAAEQRQREEWEAKRAGKQAPF
jgi:hypothetical protein